MVSVQFDSLRTKIGTVRLSTGIFLHGLGRRRVNGPKHRPHCHFGYTPQHRQSYTGGPGGLQSDAHLKPTVRGMGRPTEDLGLRRLAVQSDGFSPSGCEQGLHLNCQSGSPNCGQETERPGLAIHMLGFGTGGDPVDDLRESCNQYLPYVSPVASGSCSSLEILLRSFVLSVVQPRAHLGASNTSPLFTSAATHNSRNATISTVSSSSVSRRQNKPSNSNFCRKNFEIS